MKSVSPLCLHVHSKKHNKQIIKLQNRLALEEIENSEATEIKEVLKLGNILKDMSKAELPQSGAKDKIEVMMTTTESISHYGN